jgi:hypothetical protein
MHEANQPAMLGGGGFRVAGSIRHTQIRCGFWRQYAVAAYVYDLFHGPAMLERRNHDCNG